MHGGLYFSFSQKSVLLKHPIVQSDVYLVQQIKIGWGAFNSLLKINIFFSVPACPDRYKTNSFKANSSSKGKIRLEIYVIEFTI